MDENSKILEIFEQTFNNASEDQLYGALNYSNANASYANSTFHDIAHKEWIFDRKEVRIIFIILYSIVFCCCFFGE